MLSRVSLLTLFALAVLARAAELPLPQIDDIFLADAVTTPLTLGDGRSAIYCRAWVDEKTRATRQALWRVDDADGARPLEPGEPDGYSPMLTPDGKWILFYSSRPFADGSPAFVPVPPYSDPAADLWLIPVAGGKAIPLGGKGKPYGRVITDRFYGRVVFSPDGKRLALVADDGRDQRTEAERRDNVIVVREDQGEGYEGYGPTQVWVADLLETPGETGAARIERITPGDFWYGDPQWSPDGNFLVVVANRTADQESVRYSINRNFDLWKIGLRDRALQQLTHGPGPEFSPRLSPDGLRLVCLSSPRKGPHVDIYNLVTIDLTGSGAEKPVLDFHAGRLAPDVVSPNYPLPDDCWRDAHHVAYGGLRDSEAVALAVDVETGAVTDDAPTPAAARSPLLPRGNPKLGPRLTAKDELIRWKSFDGLEITGFLTLPPQEIAARPYKLVVIPHGGPHSRAGGGTGFDAQILATRGYAVFQPNFRGSAGQGLAFLDANRLDLGGADMRDILVGIDQLIAQGIADRDRQFVYGVSYGGFMTSWLVGHTKQFRAAVAQNAVTDLNAMWGLSDLQSWTEWEMGGLPWEVPERMREHSPISYAPAVSTPTLILHSLNDRRCPVPMGRMFYRALKKAGVETELVIYPDEGHPIKQPAHRADVLRRVLDWFEKHDRQ